MQGHIFHFYRSQIGVVVLGGYINHAFDCGGRCASGIDAECYTEDGFIKTGDRGEYPPEGLLKITGRTKELLKPAKASI